MQIRSTLRRDVVARESTRDCFSILVRHSTEWEIESWVGQRGQAALSGSKPKAPGSAGGYLLDPQFAPKVLAKPEIQPMIDLVAAAAQRERANLFHRFAIMRHWHQAARMPFEAFLSADQLHMNDWGYGCFAKLLADSITDAASRSTVSGRQ
jgi:acyl-CoA thioesterase I